MDRILVVGGGLAGLRAAESLRSLGYEGRLQVIGREQHMPYTRPPLSKGFLVDEEPPDVALRFGDDLQIEWLLGTAATDLDVHERVVRLGCGQALHYDGLVIATGARAKPWPGPKPQCSDVIQLRNLDEAARLRYLLHDSPRRFVVIGAGFIGGEFVSSARGLGHDVALVDVASQPLEGVLGPEVGRALADLHRSRGVDLRLRQGVDRIESRSGRLAGVRLASGELLEADVCVLALGVVADVAWLSRSPLDVKGGVLCHADLSVVGASGVVAAGDVVRWPHRLFDSTVVNVGHWSNAAAQALHATRTLLDAETQSFDLPPSFWSSVHGLSIRSVGLPAIADEVRVLDGDLDSLDVRIAYLRQGSLVGVVGLNRRVDAFASQLGRPIGSTLSRL